MLSIIAGPCSVDEKNINEVEEILNIEINGKKAIAGTRVVGLKSRTNLDSSGNGMGMDYEIFNKNLDILMKGGTIDDLIDFPSVLIAKEIQDKFNCIIATEIMNPIVQMPILDRLLSGPVMPWNPAVNALGWGQQMISKFCEKHNNWFLGIKNPKNLGISVENSEKNGISAPMEKVWLGLASYSDLSNERKILIHRGVDSEIKTDFRSDVVHQCAKRTKENADGIKLYFDPSHSFGPKKRDEIVNGTIEAMKMKDKKGNFLYDGILIEVGTSVTDTKQHITISELKEMVVKLNEFRKF